MFQRIKDWLKFPVAKNDKERYEQLILEESFRMMWRINWERTKQYGFWMVKLWTVVAIIIFYGVSEHSSHSWPWYSFLWFWFVCSAGFFILSWPSVLCFSLLSYYFRLPLLFLNPLCWVAMGIYGYRFEDDIHYFRRIVPIRAQDRLLLEKGIDTNLRN